MMVSGRLIFLPCNLMDDVTCPLDFILSRELPSRLFLLPLFIFVISCPRPTVLAPSAWEERRQGRARKIGAVSRSDSGGEIDGARIKKGGALVDNSGKVPLKGAPLKAPTKKNLERGNFAKVARACGAASPRGARSSYLHYSSVRIFSSSPKV